MDRRVELVLVQRTQQAIAGVILILILASLAKGAQPGVRKLHFAGEKLAEEIFAKFSNILMANEGRRLRPAWPKVRGEEVQKTKTKKVLTCIPF